MSGHLTFMVKGIFNGWSHYTVITTLAVEYHMILRKLYFFFLKQTLTFRNQKGFLPVGSRCRMWGRRVCTWRRRSAWSVAPEISVKLRLNSTQTGSTRATPGNRNTSNRTFIKRSLHWTATSIISLEKFAMVSHYWLFYFIFGGHLSLVLRPKSSLEIKISHIATRLYHFKSKVWWNFSPRWNENCKMFLIVRTFCFGRGCLTDLHWPVRGLWMLFVVEPQWSAQRGPCYGPGFLRVSCSCYSEVWAARTCRPPCAPRSSSRPLLTEKQVTNNMIECWNGGWSKNSKQMYYSVKGWGYKHRKNANVSCDICSVSMSTELLNCSRTFAAFNIRHSLTSRSTTAEQFFFTILIEYLHTKKFFAFS